MRDAIRGEPILRVAIVANEHDVVDYSVDKGFVVRVSPCFFVQLIAFVQNTEIAEKTVHVVIVVDDVGGIK